MSWEREGLEEIIDQRDAATARAERAEAATQRVRELATGWATDPGFGEIFFNDAAEAILAALDSTDPESTEVEFPQPCQPIGCDNGYHLPGCFFEAVDADADAQRPEERSDEEKP